MLDLKYQQSELDFCAKSLAKVIPILVCYSANCPCMGRDTYMLGTFSLIFRESIHHTVKFLQKKKKIFSKTHCKKEKKIQIIILHVLRLFKKNDKKEKTKKKKITRDCACKESN